jgi:cytochrome P450
MGPGVDLLRRSVLFSDSPEHERLRRALGGTFTPRSVRARQDRIVDIVHAAVTAPANVGELDVWNDIAQVVPLAVMCDWLDVDPETAFVLQREAPHMTAVLDPLSTADEMQDALAAAFRVLLEVVPMIADRQGPNGTDVISSLLREEPDRPGMDNEEAILTAMLLLVAGQETTANLIANAVVCLHAHPHLADLARDDPLQVSAVIEEALRFESPVQLTSRISRERIDLGGVALQSGSQVLVSIGAANRDPAAFVMPESFRMASGSRRHLAFGHGPHFCAGAALARATAQTVLSALLDMNPALEVQELQLERGRSRTFRRMERLVLRA